MLGVAFGDHRLDASRADSAPVGVVVIAAIGEQDVGPLAWAAHLARERLDSIQQREQLRDVVTVTAGQRQRQRQTASVGQEMML